MRWASADKKAFNDPIISKSWEKFCPNNFSMIELQARNMDYGIFIPRVPELQTLYRLAIFNGNNSDSSGGPTPGEQAAGWYILLFNYICDNVRKLVASLQLRSRSLTHRMCQMFKIRCSRVLVWMNIGRLIANNFQETAQKLWSSTFLGGVERVHDVTDKIIHLSRKIGISFQCCDFQV